MNSKILIFVLASVLTSVSFGDACKRVYRPQLQANALVRSNMKFETGRDLDDYNDNHPRLKTDLSQLNENDYVYDFGAGKGRAAIQFLERALQAGRLALAPRLAIVAFKLDRWFKFPSFDGKLITKEGDLFENMKTEDWPKAKVATDIFGVLSYTEDLSLSLNKMLDLLTVNGTLYITTLNYRTSFIDVDGQKMGYDQFLKMIPGLRIEGRYGNYRITKMQDHIVVPELTLISYDSKEKPPQREFRIEPSHY